MALAAVGATASTRDVPHEVTEAITPADALPTQIPGFLRELRTIRVHLPDSAEASLEVLITRPTDGTHLPLVVLNHGTPGGDAACGALNPTGLSAQAMAFARRGYAAVVLMRRGFGRSDGPNAEGQAFGNCSDPHYAAGLGSASADVLAGVKALANESWVDASRIVLLGGSSGGMAVVAGAGSNPDGVVGIISFAGGIGFIEGGRILDCHPDRLVNIAREVGKRARVPSLWVHSENDQVVSPSLARQMADAYRIGGAPLEFVTAPAFGSDGHNLFAEADTVLWWQWVGPFLGSLGLPTEVVHPAAPTRLRPPAHVPANGRELFARYAASDGFEKAFAVNAKGDSVLALGLRTPREASAAALEACGKNGPGCVLYAVGNTYAAGGSP